MAQILVVDDHPAFGKLLVRRLTRLGHEVQMADTLVLALDLAKTDYFDLVFLDVRLPDGNGLEAIPHFKRSPSHPEVIIMTGLGDPEGAELAVKSGAWDYLEKPTSLNELLVPLKRALEYRQTKSQTKPGNRQLNRSSIIGSSEPLLECLSLMTQIAASEANVLVTGETGVGKELFSKVIHQNSSRSTHNFIVVDCTALPENLVESILFGHEKNAFTGAETSQLGLVTQADQGTLFLDEIGELNLNIQKKFLRVLQEHSYRPVGAKQEMKSRFRLIAATNRNLDDMAHTGQFRSDLLFRLRTMTLRIPPLRERSSDIRDLAVFLLNNLSNQYKVPQKIISPDFFEALETYAWPGNVRELQNIIEETFHLGLYEPILFAKHLPERIRIHAAKAALTTYNFPQKQEPMVPNSVGPESVTRHDPQEIFPPFKHYRDEGLKQIEKEYLLKLIRQTQGSIKEACQISGLGRTHLYNLMKKHDISRLGWAHENSSNP